MTAQELLNWAKTQYQKEKDNYQNYESIIYVLRDNEHIIAAELNGLCWSMTSPDFFGYISEGDMEGLLESFEEYVNEL